MLYKKSLVYVRCHVKRMKSGQCPDLEYLFEIEKFVPCPQMIR